MKNKMTLEEYVEISNRDVFIRHAYKDGYYTGLRKALELVEVDIENLRAQAKSAGYPDVMMTKYNAIHVLKEIKEKIEGELK